MTLGQVVVAALIGSSGGFLGGLLGVGGGILMVPLMISVLHKSVHDAKACSLAIICFIGVVGTIPHQLHRRLDWHLILVAGLFGAAASVIGVQVSERVSREWLLRIFSVLLMVVGAKYFVDTLRPTPTPPAMQAEAR